MAASCGAYVVLKLWLRPVIFKKYRTRAVFSLMQTREGVWQNEKVCVNPSRRGEGLHKLSSSPKLTRVIKSDLSQTAYYTMLNKIYQMTRYSFACIRRHPLTTPEVFFFFHQSLFLQSRQEYYIIQYEEFGVSWLILIKSASHLWTNC